jgi:WD40 repeat protein
VIAVDSTGIVWQIDVATGSRTTLGPAPPRAFEIDLDSSRRRVAIGWRDGETIDVLELGSPDPPQQVPLPAGFDPRQALVTWSPGGDLVVCSRNGSLCTISSDLTHAMRIAAPLRDPVQKVAVAPVDPPRVAAAGGHSAIVPLPGGFATGRPSPPLPLDVGEEGSSVAWSPDATLIACGTRSGRVVLFDGATGAVHGTLVPHERDALAVAFSRDGRILVSADPGCVRISDVATLTTLDEIRPDWHVKVLRLTEDDRCLVLGGHSLDAAAHGGRLAVMDLDRP